VEQLYPKFTAIRQVSMTLGRYAAGNLCLPFHLTAIQITGSQAGGRAGGFPFFSQPMKVTAANTMITKEFRNFFIARYFSNT